MRLVYLFLIIALFMSTAQTATAAGFARVGTFGFTWEGIFTSGRLAALGGSDMADGSASTALLNVAPLSRKNGLEVSYDHADYFSGLEFATFAGTAEWNSLRLNVAQQEFIADDQLIRTAYNPEGTGETFDSISRITVMGLSYDIGRGLIHHPDWRWSVGASWRHYYNKFADASQAAETYDLGSTLRWTKRYGGGWVAITSAVTWQNLGEKTIPFDDRESVLPQTRRAGLTMETAMDWTGHNRNLFKFLMAHNRYTQLGLSSIPYSTHTGFEMTLLDILAFRLGHSTKVSGGISSWGFGLNFDRGQLGPFSINVDMGQMSYDNILSTDDYAIWGLRVGYDF